MALCGLLCRFAPLHAPGTADFLGHLGIAEVVDGARARDLDVERLRRVDDDAPGAAHRDSRLLARKARRAVVAGTRDRDRLLGDAAGDVGLDRAGSVEDEHLGVERAETQRRGAASPRWRGGRPSIRPARMLTDARGVDGLEIREGDDDPWRSRAATEQERPPAPPLRALDRQRAVANLGPDVGQRARGRLDRRPRAPPPGPARRRRCRRPGSAKTPAPRAARWSTASRPAMMAAIERVPGRRRRRPRARSRAGGARPGVSSEGLAKGRHDR